MDAETPGALRIARETVWADTPSLAAMVRMFTVPLDTPGDLESHFPELGLATFAMNLACSG
jgi:hypothetical protein